MVKIIDAKTITEKKKKTTKSDNKATVADDTKPRMMTYDEIWARFMDLQKENDALKNECKKLTNGCQDLSDANQRLNKQCNEILAEKANIKNDLEALKQQNFKLSETIKEQIHQLSDKEKRSDENKKLFDACLDIAACYQKQRKYFRRCFVVAVFALIIENVYIFYPYFQAWIENLR